MKRITDICASYDQIVIQAGPLHLFWNTCLYFVLELSKNKKVVLVVDRPYANSEKFQSWENSVARNIEISYMDYKCHAGVLYKLNVPHVFNARSALMLNNLYYIPNQILYLTFLNNNGSQDDVYIYQNGRQAMDPELDAKKRLGNRINFVKNTFLFMKKFPNSFVSATLFLREFFRDSVFYFISSLFIFRKIGMPKYNPVRGSLRIQFFCRKDKINSALCFSESDLVSMKHLGYKRFQIIEHPVIGFSENINFERSLITIFTSYGGVSQKLFKGERESDLLLMYSSGWSDIILKCVNKYPKSRIVLKNHPVVASDPFWIKFNNILLRNFGNRIEFDTTSTAEDLVFSSKMVLGETSTILWWSSLQSNVESYCIDIFGFGSSKEMSSCNDLVVISDKQYFLEE